MKIIFLDVDGVLNTDAYLEEVREKGLITGTSLRDPSDRYMIDPTKVELLNQLLSRTDANIVISSSWRHIYDIGMLRKFLQLQGFRYPERIVDMTTLHRRFGYRPRGGDIRGWLQDHPETTAHVALDDDPSTGGWSLNWVATTPMYGLTAEHVEEALKYLEIPPCP